MKDKFGSIQWVIDALKPPQKDRPQEWDARNIDGKWRTDSTRADRDLSWCPICKRKWNIQNKRFWASVDQKLWKEKICRDCDSDVK